MTGYGGILRWRGHAWAVTITRRWPWIHVRSVRQHEGARMAGYHVGSLAAMLPGRPSPAGDLPATIDASPPDIDPRGGIRELLDPFSQKGTSNDVPFLHFPSP